MNQHVNTYTLYEHQSLLVSFFVLNMGTMRSIRPYVRIKFVDDTPTIVKINGC